ncbi:MAG: sigma-70 family RNA polymerase sigma factor [Pirellulales bacterium]|nr:sigma-70 family RNA polymerase sigma factor [Pirellulales bacterium]
MSSDTQHTFLERLREGMEPLAWDAFFERYWKLVYSFAKNHGCSDDTAEDIVQDVMFAVFDQREVFRYDPSRGRFRNWLLTVVRNTISKHRRQLSERIRARGGDSDGGNEPEAKEIPPDAAWDATFEQALLIALLEIVRQEVTPATFQAFELTALHAKSGEEVAEMTGLSRNGVYSARKRVLLRLRELGARYREDGQLTDRIKEALESFPNAAIERSMTTRMEETAKSR